jgi:hypothetical protein
MKLKVRLEMPELLQEQRLRQIIGVKGENLLNQED